MNIKNYTSEVEVSKSMAKIDDMLVEIGASNISKKYVDKICTGITFLYTDIKHEQTLAFHLKAQVNEVFETLWKDVTKPRPDTRNKIMQQANRTAWKILSDWTEIQCTMILLGRATPLQMFLPFLYDVDNDETFYDKVISGKMPLLLAEYKK